MDPQGNIRPASDEKPIKAHETEVSALEAELLKAVDKKERWALLKRIRSVVAREEKIKVVVCKTCKRPVATARGKLVQASQCSMCLSREKAQSQVGQPLPKVDYSPRQRRKASIRIARARERARRGA